MHAVYLKKPSYNLSSSSITLKFNVTCFIPTGYTVDNITNLYLEVVETDCTENCPFTNTSFTILCDQNSTSVSIDNLKSLTSYNLSIIWISPIKASVACKILDTMMATQ